MARELALLFSVIFLFIGNTDASVLWGKASLELRASSNGDLVVNGTCYGGAKNIDVYPSGENEPLYSVCFNDSLATTIFSKSYIDGSSKAERETVKRPKFRDQNLFSFDPNEAYRNSQETMERLFPDESTFDKYFPTDEEGRIKKSYQFDRGHLFPKLDPLLADHQDATFFYINAVPQWHVLNNGNWKGVESQVNTLAHALKVKLHIWTGTHEILSLPDENNNDVPLYLGPIDRTMPVPKILWKVAYLPGNDVTSSQAIAIVQVNNPYFRPSEEQVLCADICDTLDWFKIASKKRKNAAVGFTYCCDVEELRKVVPSVPKLEYAGVLSKAHPFAEIEEDEGFEEGEDSEESREDVSESEDENDSDID